MHFFRSIIVRPVVYMYFISSLYFISLLSIFNVKAMSAVLTEEQVRERRNMIRRLQAELRVEEAKLVFLKKMKMSQQAYQASLQNKVGCSVFSL